MKIIAFGASTSKKSINKALAAYAASLVENAEIEILDLSQYDIPIYSEDLEKEIDPPQGVQNFVTKIKDADGLIVSFAEHNGSYTAAYKNLFDWASRIEQKVYQGTPAVFLATSPGPGGASSVLKQAEASVAFFGADLKASWSIPDYYDNFDSEHGVLKTPEMVAQLRAAVQKLSAE